LQDEDIHLSITLYEKSSQYMEEEEEEEEEEEDFRLSDLCLRYRVRSP
jgi:hypothetical protein